MDAARVGRAQDLEQLSATFRLELEERVRVLHQLLLRLERDEGGEPARSETLDALFRETHTLKGLARVLALYRVAHVAHALETALDVARRGGTTPSDAWFDAARGAVDIFVPLYAAAQAGEAAPPELAAVLAGLAGLAALGASNSPCAGLPISLRAPGPTAALPAAPLTGPDRAPLESPVTLSTILGPFERMVRDLALQQGKEARLLVHGRDLAIQRAVFRDMCDALLHLLRNAVAHGIESPDERQARGKPRCGAVRLSVEEHGGALQIVVEDDGAGLDLAAVRRHAVKTGLLDEAQAEALDDRSAIDLIFRPGFSTATMVDEIAGRGIGMDAVRERVGRLNGRLQVSSAPGYGTRFALVIPLPLPTPRADFEVQAAA